MKSIILNVHGIDQLKDEVKKHTGQELTYIEAAVWASEIEAQWKEGDPVMFEISQSKTFSGRPEVICICENGYEIEDWDEE